MKKEGVPPPSRVKNALVIVPPMRKASIND